MLLLLQAYGIGFVECGHGMCSFPSGNVSVSPDGTLKVGEISLKLLGKYTSIRREGEQGRVNLFFAGGRKTLRAYRRVVLEGEGVRAILSHGEEGTNLQFVFSAGKTPTARLKVGADSPPELSGNGLTVKGGKTRIRLDDLHAYQGSEELPLEVRVRGDVLEFSARGYDPRFPVVIDPVIAVFVASSGADFGYDVLAAPDGTVYVVGKTRSFSDFAPSRNVFGSTGLYDAFVSRLSGDLSTHLSTAIVAGSGDDEAKAITYDSTGNVVVVGNTASSDFAPSRTVMGTPGGGHDVFITKLSADLSTHLKTVILTGSMYDYAEDVLTAPNGDIILTGSTWNWGTSDFAPSRTQFGTNNEYDAFITRLSGDLSAHIATAVVGSSRYDWPLAVSFKPSGNILITGYTASSGDYAPNRNIFGTPGGNDAFITELSPDLSSHVRTTVLASTWGDAGHGIKLNSSGQIVVGGEVQNLNDFVPSDTFGFCGSGTGSNSFVSLLDTNLTPIRTVVVCCQLADRGYDVALRNDTVLLSGEADDYSTLPNPRVVSGNPGGTDIFISYFPPDLSGHISTLVIAGSGGEDGRALSVGPAGDVYVAGTSAGSLGDLADVRDTFGTPSPGYQEAYVARIVEPLGAEDGLKVSEGRKEGRYEVKVSDGNLKVLLPSPGYVGYDVYSSDGRVVHRESIGYLSPGTHTFALPALPSGTYLLKVRVGKKMKVLKVVM